MTPKTDTHEAPQQSLFAQDSSRYTTRQIPIDRRCAECGRKNSAAKILWGDRCETGSRFVASIARRILRDSIQDRSPPGENGHDQALSNTRGRQIAPLARSASAPRLQPCSGSGLEK